VRLRNKEKGREREKVSESGKEGVSGGARFDGRQVKSCNSRAQTFVHVVEPLFCEILLIIAPLLARQGLKDPVS
jgi:hypothetical protein